MPKKFKLNDFLKQSMAVGVSGLFGQSALKHVKVSDPEADHVIILRLRMEETIVSQLL